MTREVSEAVHTTLVEGWAAVTFRLEAGSVETRVVRREAVIREAAVAEEIEPIDLAFNHWFNQAQPLTQIVQDALEGPMAPRLAKAIKNQIKHAFTHGYARGVAAEAAKFPPDDPQLGPIR